MIVDVAKKPKSKIVVLKPQTERLLVEEIINKKKTKAFRRFLKTPEPYEVHVRSHNLIYEPLIILSGKYSADFFRKALHEVRVVQNVKELVFEDGIFSALNFSTSAKIESKM